MTTKTIPLSVRITPKDAEFIASLEIDDAVTPSDKLRALLKNAREKSERLEELSSCMGLVRTAIDPLFNRVKSAELNHELHSELISSFNDWLVNLLGYIASLDTVQEKDMDLEAIEAEIVNRIFRLFSVIGRMCVTSEAPCYNPQVLNNKLQSLKEILEIMQQRINKESSYENTNRQ